MFARTQLRIAFTVASLLAYTVITPNALAGAGHSDGDEHGHSSGLPMGEPGKAANVDRTIEIMMYDNYYEPEELDVKPGETIRFVLKNAGEFVHEFNIGTAEMHVAHGPEMMMMMEHGVLEADRINWEAAEAMQKSMGHGMHEEANSVMLEPGQSGEVIWKFAEADNVEFACNIPGHYDSGMVGEIDFKSH